MLVSLVLISLNLVSKGTANSPIIFFISPSTLPERFVEMSTLPEHFVEMSTLPKHFFERWIKLKVD